jgi:hypothetical protein
MSSPNRLRLAAVAALGSALLGCSAVDYSSTADYFDRRETIGLSAGDAMRTNQVTHMVDPWPAHAANRNIAFNGEKMQTAVERYRTNRVIPPVNATTSSLEYQRAQAAAAPPPSVTINNK